MKQEITTEFKVGDKTLPYKTCNPPTTIVEFRGNIVYLADGTSMHKSFLKRPKE